MNASPHRLPPLPISTERLVLRPYRLSDVGWLAEVYGKEEVVRYLGSLPWTRANAREHTLDRMHKVGLHTGALALAIEWEGRGIGNMALTEEGPGNAQIGWVLDPEAAGQGLAREAAWAVINLAFAHYRLHRLSARIDSRNAASVRLAKALGMRHEATLRQSWLNRGVWADVDIYAILRDEYRAALANS